MVRTLLIESKVASHFWAEAMSIACYIINHVFRLIIEEKKIYELFRDRNQTFHIFVCSEANVLFPKRLMIALVSLMRN